MIEVVNYINREQEAFYETILQSAYSGVRNLRPDLPEHIKIHFTDRGLIHSMATGGHAYATDTINLVIDPNEKDSEKVATNLRSTLFHEAFHVSMNFTRETGPFGLMECVIHEGAATVFEIKYTDSPAGHLYGNYQSAGEEQLREWFLFATNPSNNVLTKEGYGHFAYYDPSDDTRWKLYKLGTWLVDKYLKANSADINDLSSADVRRIIEYTGRF